MNKKADKKLSDLADFIQDTIPNTCHQTEKGFLYRKLDVVGKAPLSFMSLVYSVENRFAAASYNLFLQTRIQKEEGEAYSFKLQYEGMMRIQKAAFCSTADKALDERGQRVLKALNASIILDKIKELNLPNVFVFYKQSEGCWQIVVQSMIGSSTWILIPPVMQLIMPTKSEIYPIVELMQLLSAAAVYE